jgi:hypothetical protein
MSDLTADQSSALQQLLDGGPLRHSIDPPASDFTGVTDANAWLSQLLQWQSAGIIGNWVPNDNFAVDGVRTRWRLGVNGLMMCGDNGIVPTEVKEEEAATEGE